MLTGKDLIAMGHKPAKWFAGVIEHANETGIRGAELEAFIKSYKPKEITKIPLHESMSYDMFIDGTTDAELENIQKVRETMDVLTKTPTITYGAVMPDACPAGPVGTIPVGGVVVAQNAIHPGLHSADICCSLMVSVFNDIDPKTLLDLVHEQTHFGPGGRPDFQPPKDFMKKYKDNPWIRGNIITRAMTDFGTQGDGNHFAFVGISSQTGKTCLVTHHGSRGPGALLYKAAMKVAEAYRAKHSPKTLKQNAWIPYDTDDGQTYWEALQLIREWTKLNHTAIHDSVGGSVIDRHWNEHNFVFKDGDSFIHAKGVTPMLGKYLPDNNCGRSIIPLNMAQPVLIAQAHPSNEFGFAPHGAGRNLSRTAHKKTHGDKTDEQIFAEETQGIDARFFSGKIDTSELPSAYKNAKQVEEQIEQYKLAVITDKILPYGSIMAGDWQSDAPWKKKK